MLYLQENDGKKVKNTNLKTVRSVKLAANNNSIQTGLSGCEIRVHEEDLEYRACKPQE